MHSTQYATSRQAPSAYQVPLPHHRQPSSSSSGSYPSPSDTNHHSPGPNYAYAHRSNGSLGNGTDVKREYDEPPPTNNRYYPSNGYGYSSGGNSGYGGPSSAQYYQPSSQGAQYQPSAQFGPGYSSVYVSSRFTLASLRLTDEWSRPRCSDSPPVSPVTSTPDYFVNQSSSSSTSSPTSPASPNGYHYNWQTTHPPQTDGSSGHYTPTDLPPQYNPQGSAHNPFQPCVYRITSFKTGFSSILLAHLVQFRS
jgi:hypothetical protein